ncbi:hypothetical protein Ct61P_13970 [Colletotrichum tofieldiae]|nr:hypothetical protein Ct61P_13970 [Colletotrichum tofieldiae]
MSRTGQVQQGAPPGLRDGAAVRQSFPPQGESAPLAGPAKWVLLLFIATDGYIKERLAKKHSAVAVCAGGYLLLSHPGMVRPFTASMGVARGSSLLGKGV